MEMPCAESLDVQAGHQEALFNLWSRYLTKAEKHDKKLVETWKGDADGILIFTGLFSAMVAAFTLESYKTLQPDPSATVVLLLSQISHQLAAPANDTGSPTVPTPPFHAPSSGVRVNILWFLSLCLSVSCALAAMLMQQWSRKYLHLAHGHHLDQYTGARVRAFLFLGVTKFRMTDALEFVPSILHVAVFLFFAGMVEFLLPIHRTVAVAVLCCVIFISGIYGLVTALPLLFPDCPYQTPLSPLLRQFVYGLVAGYSAMRSLLTRVAARSRSSGGSQPSFTSTALPPNPSVNWYPLFSLNGSHDPVEAALKPQLNVVATALASELTSLKGVADFECFFEGTHALLSLDHTVQSSLTVLVIQHRPKLARMLTRLFDSCTPSSDTLDSTWNRRALIGIHALWDIFFSAPPTEVHTFKTLLSIPFFVLGQRAGEPWDPVYASARTSR
ncbi:hypothetical protein BC834DRAFT_180884 [Gloeopeniophorella convolvens]|nr:hypothetical protein BC834DRAFT_180884 [Gloeopeniophorella convolvens]